MVGIYILYILDSIVTHIIPLCVCLRIVKPSSYQLEQLEAAGPGPGGLIRGLLHSVSRSRGWVLAGAALGQGDIRI